MASSILLQLPTIEGLSTVKGFEGWIELNDYNMDISNTIDAHKTADAGIKGTVTISDINCNKRIDPTSATIWKQCCRGVAFSDDGVGKIVEIAGAGDDQTKVFEVNFKPVWVSFYDGGGEDGASDLNDSFRLHFQQVCVKFTKKDGSDESAGYDLTTNETIDFFE